jgi:hypothetical protein
MPASMGMNNLSDPSFQPVGGSPTRSRKFDRRYIGKSFHESGNMFPIHSLSGLQVDEET